MLLNRVFLTAVPGSSDKTASPGNAATSDNNTPPYILLFLLILLFYLLQSSVLSNFQICTRAHHLFGLVCDTPTPEVPTDALVSWIIRSPALETSALYCVNA